MLIVLFRHEPMILVNLASECRLGWIKKENPDRNILGRTVFHKIDG
jgi:hypothetical protein